MIYRPSIWGTTHQNVISIIEQENMKMGFHFRKNIKKIVVSFGEEHHKNRGL